MHKLSKALTFMCALLTLTFCAVSCKTDDDDDPTMYTVTVSSSIEHGKVSVDKTSAEKGATVTLTLSASDGYEFGTLSVTGASNAEITTTAVTEGSKYTFTMPESNVTVSATFTALPPDMASYTVKHLQQNISDDDYTLTESETKTGTVGQSTDASAKSYEGFTAQSVTQATIAASGTVVEIKYDRKSYTVTFNANGGSTVTSQSVRYGATATKPADPTKTATASTEYTFEGWYSDSDLTTSFSFDTAITENITLYANWTETAADTTPEVFVKVTGTTIAGTETWTPSSIVFVSGRSLAIPDLYVCDHEVTQKEYEAYCKYGSTSPSDNYGKGDNYPAYYVSWYDAIVYCNLRSINEGLTPAYAISDETDPSKWTAIVSETTDGVTKYCGPSSSNATWNGMTFDTAADGYRLPTEAEWEYIARAAGSSSTTYSGSNTVGDVAWYSGNSGSKSHEVKTDKVSSTDSANALGIYDMSGNVWEWCWDSISGGSRVQRGGAWTVSAANCSVAYRDNSGPYSHYQSYGFRLVRSSSAKGSISYATTTVEKTTDDTAFTNELRIEGNGTVTYTSSDEAVATVDATTGEVTIKGAGEATITATVADSDTYTYATNTASYTLTVTQAVTIPEVFVKVTGTTIAGTETWTPSSIVFVSGRSLTIPDLYVCDHEVTRGEYKALMGTDPSRAKAYDKDGNELTGDAVLNNPVNYVNWYAAIAYCNKLSIKEGLDCAYTVSGISDWENLEYSAIPTSSNSDWNATTCNFEANGYRLPTEAEWEWLARGGQNYTYAGSNTIDDVAWYTSNTNDTGSREVKTKAANAYGLYDMSGNVWEWCWDWYESSISSSTAEAGSASGSYRVCRGGSWNIFASLCTVSYRDYGNPDCRGNILGFRVVRNAE